MLKMPRLVCFSQFTASLFSKLILFNGKPGGYEYSLPDSQLSQVGCYCRKRSCIMFLGTMAVVLPGTMVIITYSVGVYRVSHRELCGSNDGKVKIASSH